VHGVDHYLHRAHVQDAIVQKLIEAGHVVKEEQLIHVDGVAGDGELAGADAECDEVGDDLFFCLFDGYIAVDAAVVQSGCLVVAEYGKRDLVFHSSMVLRCSSSQLITMCGPSCWYCSRPSVRMQANYRIRFCKGSNPLIYRSTQNS